MADLIQTARGLKKLAQTQREQGGHEIAAKTLRQAIDLLEEALSKRKGVAPASDGDSQPADLSETRIVAELADLYGTLGGSLREGGDLVAAARAYDAGFRYESDRRYGIVNSYNAVNRLVTRILLCPLSLSVPDALRQETKLEFLDVGEKLLELQRELARQVEGMRSNDYWAAGDLAQISALNGDDRGTADALDKFASTVPPPPPDVCEAYRKVIGTLAQLDTPRKEALTKAMMWLDDKWKDASAKPLG